MYLLNYKSIANRIEIADTIHARFFNEINLVECFHLEQFVKRKSSEQTFTLNKYFVLDIVSIQFDNIGKCGFIIEYSTKKSDAGLQKQTHYVMFISQYNDSMCTYIFCNRNLFVTVDVNFD